MTDSPDMFDDDITVSVATRRGRTKLHTFSSWADTPGEWFLNDPASGRQQRAFAKARHPASRANPEPLARDRQLRRPAGDTKYGAALAFGARVDIGEGVTPEGSTLAVVCEALRGAGRTGVDLDDLKVVLSQLGSRISRLETLTDEQRRTVEPALHSEIVRRCAVV